MSASLAPVFLFRPLSSNGAVMPGAKLYTYAAGTTTPLATYTDATGSTPAANPIILDANGQCPLWLGAVAYKIELKDAAGVTQPGYPIDNVTSTEALVAQAVGALQTALANPTITTGSAMIGDLAIKPLTSVAYAGASERTQAQVNSDSVKTTSLGSKGDSTGTLGAGYVVGSATDNAPKLAAIWSNHELKPIHYPAGDYYFSTGTTFDYTTNNSVVLDKSNRVSLSGDDRNCTRLIHGGTGFLLNFSLGTFGAGTISLTTISDLGLVCSKTDASNSGLSFTDHIEILVERCMFTGFSTGLALNGVTSSAFRDLKFQACTTGILIDSTANSGSNALSFENISAHGCTGYGLKAVHLGTPTRFENMVFETCGAGGTAGGAFGAVYLNITGDSGGVGPVFENCYFEGNSGDADVVILSNSYGPVNITFINCNFMRVGTVNNVLNNIKVQSNNNQGIRLILIGCSFGSAGSYVPDTAKPYINHDKYTEVVDIGCTYGDIQGLGVTHANVGTATAVAGGAVGPTGAPANGINNTWTSTKTATGTYTVTHQGRGWGYSATDYIVTATSADATGSKAVISVQYVDPNNFKVYTGTAPGVLADSSFAFHVSKVC